MVRILKRSHQVSLLFANRIVVVQVSFRSTYSTTFPISNCIHSTQCIVRAGAGGGGGAVSRVCTEAKHVAPHLARHRERQDESGPVILILAVPLPHFEAKLSARVQFLLLGCGCGGEGAGAGAGAVIGWGCAK